MTEAVDDIDLSLLAEIPDQDLWDIMAAVQEGAKHPGDALGFGPEALNAIERMALGFYRAQVLDKAATIYGFVLRMNPARASAWRGLGACCMALKEYRLAISCFQAAVNADSEDLISEVCWAECLCHLGLKESGVQRLEAVITRGTTQPAYLPYLTRARAIVGARGGRPTTLVLKQQGTALVQQTAESLGLPGDLTPPDDDPEREIAYEDMAQDPKLKQAIQELSQAVEEGRITYAEVGGFSAKELDGVYACACKYAEMGQILEAIRIAGYLIFLDPDQARYYQLVGICMQRMKQYEPAEYYYDLALTFAPDDPMTLIYSGETKIMAGKTDEGIGMVKKGIEKAGTAPEHKAIADRGQALVRQMSARS